MLYQDPTFRYEYHTCSKPEDQEATWCRAEFDGDGTTGHRWSCRRPPGHTGEHSCPGRDRELFNAGRSDVDSEPTAEDMDYVLRSLGIVPKEEQQ